MRRRLLATALCVCGTSAGAMRVRAEQPLPVQATETVRQEILVTNQDLALVTETRRASLPAGSFEVLWANVPPSAMPETWSVTSREPGLHWLGLASPLPAQPERWLDSLVGKQVRVVRPGGAAIDAQVLEVHGPTSDLVLFKEGGDLVFGEPLAVIVSPAEPSRGMRPAGIYLKFENERAGARDLTSRFLLGKIRWEADYALTLAADEKSGRLEGWFAVENASGAEFEPGRLRLLAGVLRVAASPQPRGGVTGMAARVEAGVLASTPVSESHVYEIRAPGRLRAGRTTFPLVESVAVTTVKRYLVRASFWAVRNPESARLPVSVQYQVRTGPLARALPAGVVRVYTEQGSFFAGEDRIAHVLERTDVEIETSEAFDLSATREQVSFQQIGPRETESAFEVTVTSRKKEDVTVLVRENFAGEWNVVQSSVPATRRGAFVAEFALPVAAGATARLTYRIRARTGG